MLVKEDPGILELSPSFIVQRLVELKVPCHLTTIFTSVHVSAKQRFHRAAPGNVNMQSVNRPVVRTLHHIASKGPLGNNLSHRRMHQKLSLQTRCRVSLRSMAVTCMLSLEGHACDIECMHNDNMVRSNGTVLARQDARQS